MYLEASNHPLYHIKTLYILGKINLLLEKKMIFKMAAILEKIATFHYNFINFQYFSKIQKVVKNHFNSN
jgi:hypothetical protein